MQKVGYFLHTARITVVRGLGILPFCRKLEFLNEQGTGSVATECEKIYQQGPYPADYSNMSMAESLFEARQQAAFEGFNAEFSRNGYVLLCRVSVPFHVFSLNIIFHFYLKFRTGSRRPCEAFERIFSQERRN